MKCQITLLNNTALQVLRGSSGMLGRARQAIKKSKPEDQSTSSSASAATCDSIRHCQCVLLSATYLVAASPDMLFVWRHQAMCFDGSSVQRIELSTGQGTNTSIV